MPAAFSPLSLSRVAAGAGRGEGILGEGLQDTGWPEAVEDTVGGEDAGGIQAAPGGSLLLGLEPRSPHPKLRGWSQPPGRRV